MSDTSPRDQALFNAKRAAARPPRPGEVVWRLRNQAGRVQRCELLNDAEAGAGATKQDRLRTGWTEDTAGETGGA
jgi:hypothetical protein